MKSLPALIVITGPTASGKTALSIELAREFNGEIISADSRTIYRGMDIGTAKPVPDNVKERFIPHFRMPLPVYVITGIPHYGFDIVEPWETLTVAEYKKFALAVITNIHARGKIPFLVGGSGLYIDAITKNLEIPQVPPNKALREKLEEKSREELFEDLKRLDPETAELIDSRNRRRLIRALEIKIQTGLSKSKLARKGPRIFDVLQIGIKISKEKLYKNIEARVEEHFERGLEKEVRDIYEMLKKRMREEDIWRLPSMSGISYQEFREYFAGRATLADVARRIALHNRQYARRQMTWLKRNKEIIWVASANEARKHIKKHLA